jgi:hypothetical protein
LSPNPTKVTWYCRTSAVPPSLFTLTLASLESIAGARTARRLHRRKLEVVVAHRAAEQNLRNELKGPLMALLLACDGA